MGSLAPIREKLAKVVAMLSSDKDGDRLAAARALNRMLTENGCSIHDLSALIECEPTEAELEDVYRSGFIDGQKSVQQQQVQPYQVDWRQIAEAVVQHIDDLNDRERSLVANVMRQLRVGRDPSEKQAPWLRDIYLKLGRRYGFNTI